MITLLELKTYLKVMDSTKDEFLKTSIEMAKSELDTACNRHFINTVHTEYIYWVTDPYAIYLRNAPVNSIDSVKYWDGVNYVDLFVLPDTPANSIRRKNGLLIFADGYDVLSKDLEIVYNAGYKFEVLTGTIDGTIGTNVITGTGSLFTTELVVGDSILIQGELKKVVTITNATSLIVDTNLSMTYNDVSYYISNVPHDIRKACLHLAAYYFLESKQGENHLNKSTAHMSLGGSAGESYKSLDISRVVDNYRFMNI